NRKSPASIRRMPASSALLRLSFRAKASIGMVRHRHVRSAAFSAALSCWRGKSVGAATLLPGRLRFRSGRGPHDDPAVDDGRADPGIPLEGIAAGCPAVEVEALEAFGEGVVAVFETVGAALRLV